MELEAEGAFADADRLHVEDIALGKQHRAARQVEAFPVPLIDAARERAAAEALPGLGRDNRMIADLDLAVRMHVDALAHVPRQHLRAETEAHERLLLFQRHADPVDFGLEPVVLVVGAHRAAENDGACVIAHGLRQGLAEARAAYV